MKRDREADPNKFYTWTVRLSVAAPVVADGFNLTSEGAMDMLRHRLPYTYGHEMHAEVTLAPSAEEIAREQGYGSAAEAKICDLDYDEQRTHHKNMASVIMNEIVHRLRVTNEHLTLATEDLEVLHKLVCAALSEATGIPEEK
jgi:hypothetical protein